MYEKSINQLLMQKQQIQLQASEVEAAAKELEGRKQAYKIIGSIMVAGEARTFAEELQERKEAFELRIKAIEKQESQIKEKTQKLQKDVMEALKEK